MKREEYADALKRFLRQKNLKQQDIADKFGVNHATVNNLINGHTRFGKAKAIRWGEALGIDPIWLMTQGEQGVNPNDGDTPTTAIAKADPDTINVPVLNLDVRGGLAYNDVTDIEEYKVEPQAAALIAAHRGRVWLLDILDHYKSVHNALGTANKNLKRIAEDLGLPPITTYTARYTWATLAASIDTPIEVISQALGHTYGQAVTLGYIMPDRRKVDEANKAVLALLSGTDAAK